MFLTEKILKWKLENTEEKDLRNMKFVKRVQVSAGASHWEYCGAEHVALGSTGKLLSQGSSSSWRCSSLSWNVPFLNFYYGISYRKCPICAKTGQVPFLLLTPDTAGVKFTYRTFLSENIWAKAQQTSGGGDQFGGLSTQIFSLYIHQRQIQPSAFPGKPASWNCNAMFDLQRGSGISNLFNENNQGPNLKTVKIENGMWLYPLWISSFPGVQTPLDASVDGKIPV